MKHLTWKFVFGELCKIRPEPSLAIQQIFYLQNSRGSHKSTNLNCRAIYNNGKCEIKDLSNVAQRNIDSIPIGNRFKRAQISIFSFNQTLNCLNYPLIRSVQAVQVAFMTLPLAGLVVEPHDIGLLINWRDPRNLHQRAENK